MSYSFSTSGETLCICADHRVTDVIQDHDKWVCMSILPAADTELLQHSPESALWKGLLRLNDLLNIIQTLFLPGHNNTVTVGWVYKCEMPHINIHILLWYTLTVFIDIHTFLNTTVEDGVDNLSVIKTIQLIFSNMSIPDVAFYYTELFVGIFLDIVATWFWGNPYILNITTTMNGLLWHFKQTFMVPRG